MIEKKDLVEIGKFQKTHALKGELNAMIDVEEDFLDGDYPLVVEMDGIFVPFYPESMRPKGAESYLLKLEGIDSQEKASEFVNKVIYARREDVMEHLEIEDGELLISDNFKGYAVVDDSLGLVGTVIDFIDSPNNPLLEVATPDEEEVFIPFAEDMITEIDEGEKKIFTSLPEGLLDINR